MMGRLSSAIARMAPRTAAVPPMSKCMFSMKLVGFRFSPPVSNVMPCAFQAVTGREKGRKESRKKGKRE